jgi:hypothetical protein
VCLDEFPNLGTSDRSIWLKTHEKRYLLSTHFRKKSCWIRIKHYHCLKLNISVQWVRSVAKKSEIFCDFHCDQKLDFKKRKGKHMIGDCCDITLVSQSLKLWLPISGRPSRSFPKERPPLSSMAHNLWDLFDSSRSRFVFFNMLKNRPFGVRGPCSDQVGSSGSLRSHFVLLTKMQLTRKVFQV